MGVRRKNKNFPWNEVLSKERNNWISVKFFSKIKSATCKEFGRTNMGVLAFRARLETKDSSDGI